MCIFFSPVARLDGLAIAVAICQHMRARRVLLWKETVLVVAHVLLLYSFTR